MAKIRELALEKWESLGSDEWASACRHSYAVDQWRADERLLADAEGSAEVNEEAVDGSDT